MDLIEEFNNNFWKFTITAFFIVVIVFYIRWTRCLCKITDILSNHSAIQEEFTSKEEDKIDAAKYKFQENKQEIKDNLEEKKQEFQEKKQEFQEKKQEYKYKIDEKKKEAEKQIDDFKKKLIGNDNFDLSKLGILNKSSKPSIPDISNLISLDESDESDNKDIKKDIKKVKTMFDTNELTKAQEEAKEEEIKKKTANIDELNKTQGRVLAEAILTPISKEKYMKAGKETFTSNINSSCISNNTECGKDCDIRSPENVIAQYKNIDSLLQGCKGPYIGGETVVVKDKITGGNMCLHSKEQPTYASVDNWHM